MKKLAGIMFFLLLLYGAVLLADPEASPSRKSPSQPDRTGRCWSAVA